MLSARHGSSGPPRVSEPTTHTAPGRGLIGMRRRSKSFLSSFPPSKRVTFHAAAVDLVREPPSCASVTVAFSEAPTTSATSAITDTSLSSCDRSRILLRTGPTGGIPGCSCHHAHCGCEVLAVLTSSDRTAAATGPPALSEESSELYPALMRSFARRVSTNPSPSPVVHSERSERPFFVFASFASPLSRSARNAAPLVRFISPQCPWPGRARPAN
mmetsp:Transcript_15238/g.39266  ORF Transcript_15238/g.39266 Transcript_15238/m.39266 type:complete len:215 (+) Transcript_15238:192-836(+)